MLLSQSINQVNEVEVDYVTYIGWPKHFLEWGPGYTKFVLFGLLVDIIFWGTLLVIGLHLFRKIRGWSKG